MSGSADKKGGTRPSLCFQLKRRRLVRKKWNILLALAAIVIMTALVACQPKTVIVEREVKVTEVVTQIVKETVKETVIVEGTPKVVEKEVTKVVEKEVTTVVEKVVEVTPTPVPCMKPITTPATCS